MKISPQGALKFGKSIASLRLAESKYPGRFFKYRRFIRKRFREHSVKMDVKGILFFSGNFLMR